MYTRNACLRLTTKIMLSLLCVKLFVCFTLVNGLTLNNTETESKPINSTEDESILRHNCPSNNCGYNDSDLNFKQDKACCLRCDCSARCELRGSCCYDKELTTITRKEVCTPTMYTNRDMYLPGFKGTSSVLYQDCAMEDEELNEKCYKAPGDNISDYLPVYSNRTGIQYKNKYCAMCNNDYANYTDWTQEVRCSSLRDYWELFYGNTNPNVEVIINLQSKRLPCALYFIPPSDSYHEYCLHPQHMISSCNTSSPSYDEFQDKCSRYYSPIHGKENIFKNIFCMKCNEYLDPYISEKDCDLGQMMTIPLTAILTMSKAKPTTEIHQYNQCVPPSVFNNELNMCLNIRCPLTKLPTVDQCVPLLESVSNLNVDFRVVVKFPHSASFAHEPILDDVIRLYRHLRNSSFFCKQIVSSPRFKDGQVQSEVRIVLNIHTPIHLEDAFNEVKANIDAYNANNAAKVFHMEIGKRALRQPFYESSFDLPFEDIQGTEAYCSHTLAMSEMLFCPMVSFTKYTRLNNNAVHIDGLRFEEHEYLTIFSDQHILKSINVCLDSYISKHKAEKLEQSFEEVGNGSEAYIPSIVSSIIIVFYVVIM